MIADHLLLVVLPLRRRTQQQWPLRILRRQLQYGIDLLQIDLFKTLMFHKHNLHLPLVSRQLVQIQIVDFQVLGFGVLVSDACCL